MLLGHRRMYKDALLGGALLHCCCWLHKQNALVSFHLPCCHKSTQVIQTSRSVVAVHVAAIFVLLRVFMHVNHKRVESPPSTPSVRKEGYNVSRCDGRKGPRTCPVLASTACHSKGGQQRSARVSPSLCALAFMARCLQQRNSSRHTV